MKEYTKEVIVFDYLLPAIVLGSVGLIVLMVAGLIRGVAL